MRHKRGELHRLSDAGKVQDTALLGRLDGVRPHAIEIDLGGDRMAGDDRTKLRGTQFDSLLHHVIETCALKGRKAVAQMDWLRLRTHELAGAKLTGPLGGGDNLAFPFAVAAIEDEDVVARLQAQHVDKVVGLLRLAGDRRITGKVRIDKQALRRKVVDCQSSFPRGEN